MILVTGNPRSGTLSIKNMLRAMGYDVQHERNGTDGTASCFFFLQATYYPREKLTAKRHMNDRGKDESFDILLPYYEVIIHLVRNPLLCIPSMAKVVGVGHQRWLADHGIIHIFDAKHESKLTWAAEAWYNTNRVIENNLVHRLEYNRMRIEHVKHDWPKTIVDKPEIVLHQHAGSGTRKSKPLMKRELKKISPLAGRIIKMANKYGYRI